MFELDEALDWRQALREHRKTRGFTQTRLAREASLSLSALKQYETGQRHPSAEALDAIIAALGLTAEQRQLLRCTRRHRWTSPMPSRLRTSSTVGLMRS